MDDGGTVSILHVVVGLNAVVGLHPVLVTSEEFSGGWPGLEFDVLLSVLTEVS